MDWEYNLKSFAEKPDKWYNLSSGRFVKKPPAKKLEVAYSLIGIRILGTDTQVAEFWKQNFDRITVRFPKTNLEKLLFKPFEDVAFLSKEAEIQTQLCKVDPEGKLICKPKSKDVEQLSDSEIQQLDVFNFGNCFLKGKIMDVTDGDTIKAVVYIKFSDLQQVRGSPNKTISSVYSKDKRAGFFTILVLRLFGYDAIEKDQPGGQLAKKLLNEKLASLNNIVWIQIIDSTIAKDKYGRCLSILYEDEAKQHLLNDYLYQQGKSLNMKLVNPYNGGTKASF